MPPRWASISCITPLRIEHLACSLFAALLTANVCNAAPADIWPSQVPWDPASLSRALGQIDANAASLPGEVRPAVEFEKVYLRILSGAGRDAWLADLRKSASGEGAVGDAARVWLARVEMEEIDAVLRDYYAENVGFPASLEQAKLPEGLRKDPWGGKWAYRTRAPDGFAGMSSQRYDLGPARFPKLTPLKEAVRTRPKERDWKLSLRAIAGSNAVEFRLGGAAMPFATLEKGGKVQDCTLVFIGGNWALMAGPDQLFALKVQ